MDMGWSIIAIWWACSAKTKPNFKTYLKGMQPYKQIAKTTSQHIAFANKHAKWDMMGVGHFYNLCVVIGEKKGNYLPLVEENCS